MLINQLKTKFILFRNVIPLALKGLEITNTDLQKKFKPFARTLRC